ncbi:MAG: glycosyltransferase family 39 protein [Anaerolineae bacterium]|nr:glycosyltransferase family 39 protein [Anaerolineae bacterium]
MSTSRRAGLLLIGVMLSASVLLLLPPPLNRILLLLMSGLALLLALRRVSFLEPSRYVRALTQAIKKRRVFLGRITAIAAMALLTAALYFFQPRSSFASVPYGALLTVLGGVALMIALRLRYGAAVSVQNTGAAVLHPPVSGKQGLMTLRIGALGIGVVLLALLTEINASILDVAALRGISLHVQFGLLITALPLLVVGLGVGAEAHPSGRGSAGVGSRRVWLHYGLLVAICILGAVLRLYRLGTLHQHFIDELNFTGAVMQLIRSPLHYDQGLLRPFDSIAAFPWLYPYLQSLTVDWIGRDLAGLRLVSALFGILGVPAVYLLGRALFDRPTALLAALLLATFPPHMQFSRLGLNNIADPAMGTLALASLLGGLRWRNRWCFALGGVALGLTQYFYEGGRFLYPILILGWLAWFMLTRRRTQVGDPAFPHNTKIPYGGLARYFTGALLAGAPIYLTLIGNNLPLAQRFSTTGVGGSYWLDVLAYEALQSADRAFIWPFTIYVGQPETSLYYGGEFGLLLPILGPFFLVGIFALLLRLRQMPVVLLMWVLLTSLGNMLISDSASSARYVVVFPALMLIVAAGVRTIIELSLTEQSDTTDGQMHRWRALPKLQQIWQALSPLIQPIRIMLAVGIVFAVVQVTYYLGPHRTAFHNQTFPYYDAEDALFRAASLPRGTRIYIIGNHAPSQGYLSTNMSFLDDDKPVTVQRRGQIISGYTESLPTEFPAAFFLEPDDMLSLNLLRARFRLDGPYSSPFDIPAKKQYLMYVYDPRVAR